MDMSSRLTLKQRTWQSLNSPRCNPRLLALCHTAVTLTLTTALTLVNFFITRRVGSTGGLSGLGTRSLLLTVQSILSFAGMFLLPFWQIGFVHTGLAMARRQVADNRTLFEGFRRFWPVLRLQLLKMVMLMIVMALCMQVSSMLYSIVALPGAMMDAMESMATDPSGSLILDETVLEASMPSQTPLLILFGVMVLALAVFLFYKFRMADYVIMDESPKGALAALGRSHRLTRGNRLALLRLDLSLWWYYALHLLAVVIGFGDQLLALMGIDLGIHPDVAFFLFYGIYVVFQLLLAWFAGSYVQTTYSWAYELLQQEFEADPTPRRRRFPWDLLPY